MALDLSRIDALTREVLETEARKRGIRSPEFRTRTELVRLILRNQYGDRVDAPRELLAQGARGVSQARQLLGEVVGAALAVLPEPLDVLVRLRSRWPLQSDNRAPRAPSAAPQPATTPRPAMAPQPASRAAGQPTTVTQPQPPTQEVRAATPAAAPTAEPAPKAAAPAATFAESGPSRPSERPSVAPRGAFSTPPPPAPPRPSSEPATRTFIEEPIRTRSMARLLAAQGHRERALAIYEELLAQNSEDAALRRETDALRRGDPLSEPRLSSPAPALDVPLELPDGGDRLWCEGNPEEGLRLRWQLSDQGQERARAVLGHHGELAIRVVAIKPDSADVVRSEITEHGPVSARGEWVAPGLYSATRCFAAVGLRDGERFVAVVHARPLAG